MHYRPQNEETLGVYLRRLRNLAASARGHAVTQEEIARKSTEPGHAQSFTAAWLSLVELDRSQTPGFDRLKTLAEIYTELLGEAIQAEWLLSLAGYAVEEMTLTVPPSDNLIGQYLQNNDVMALTILAGMLARQGHREDVGLLLTVAKRLVKAKMNEEIDETQLLADPLHSQHVKDFMKMMGL